MIGIDGDVLDKAVAWQGGGYGSSGGDVGAVDYQILDCYAVNGVEKERGLPFDGVALVVEEPLNWL